MNSFEQTTQSIFDFINADEANQRLYESILPDISVPELTKTLSEYILEYLGSEIQKTIYTYVSVGLSLGFSLTNGVRVFCKISLETNSKTIAIKTRYHKFLFEQGINCPKVLAGPLIYKKCAVVFMEFHQNGDFVDTRVPKYKTEMIKELVKLNSQFGEYQKRHGITDDEIMIISDIASEKRWYRTHNNLFDFDKFQNETAWIDSKMADSMKIIKKLERYDRYLISHGDWSGKHFRFIGDRISIIYDWDSQQYMSLYRIIAKSALTHTYNDEIGNIIFADKDQIVEFIEEYQNFSGSRFDEKELGLISAYCTYVASYICKCLCTYFENREVDNENQILSDLRDVQKGAYIKIGV